MIRIEIPHAVRSDLEKHDWQAAARSLLTLSHDNVPGVIYSVVHHVSEQQRSHNLEREKALRQYKRDRNLANWQTVTRKGSRVLASTHGLWDAALSRLQTETYDDKKKAGYAMKVVEFALKHHGPFPVHKLLDVLEALRKTDQYAKDQKVNVHFAGNLLGMATRLSVHERAWDLAMQAPQGKVENTLDRLEKFRLLLQAEINGDKRVTF